MPLVLQWTVEPTAATGCALLGAHRALSNAVQVTIGNRAVRAPPARAALARSPRR
jgi:hypothetical protein